MSVSPDQTADLPERWCFRDITPDSFRWTGEVSEDQRRSWVLDEQMIIRRRKDAAAS
jgi:hypothetical protein